MTGQNIINAHYDPTTDKIYGAKKDTILYYHEEGHRHWYKRGYETALQMWMGYMLLGAVALNSLDSPMAKYFVLLVAILLLTSEIHAWFFAFKKWLRLKNEN